MSDAADYSSVVEFTPDSRRTPSTSAKVLRIYVNDHRAGAVGGVALYRRIADRYSGTPLGEAAGELVGAIEDDRQALERWAHTHGIAPNPLKKMVTRIVEIVARAKLNGYVIRRSPLSPVLEIEALLAGIDAKCSLWHSLQAAGLPVGGSDYDVLIGRATEQRAQLVPFHANAAVAALTAFAEQTPPAGKATTSG